MNLIEKVLTTVKSPSIGYHYAHFHLQRLAGKRPGYDFGAGRIRGFLNFNSYLGAVRNAPEPREISHFCEVVSDVDVILDVGANYGVFSSFFGRAAPNARVISFEPVPKTFGALSENIRRLSLGNVSVMNIAVGSADQTVRMTNSADPATNRIDGSGEINVQMRSIDSLVTEKDLGGAIYIKIDVEGAELQVLMGAQQAFLDGKIVGGLIEVCPNNLKQFGYDAMNIWSWLSSVGYSLASLETKREFSRSDIEALPPDIFVNMVIQPRQTIEAQT